MGEAEDEMQDVIWIMYTELTTDSNATYKTTRYHLDCVKRMMILCRWYSRGSMSFFRVRHPTYRSHTHLSQPRVSLTFFRHARTLNQWSTGEYLNSAILINIWRCYYAVLY
jgi:hypothetical protein